MSSRNHIKKLINKEKVDHCGFWLGKPHTETTDMLNKVLKTATLEEIQQVFQDDIRWITPQYVKSTYAHPDGFSMRPWKDKNPHGLSGKGLLSYNSTIKDLDAINFPKVEHIDFTEILEMLNKPEDVYRLSGFWSPFYHDLSYLFGTEELLVFLMTDPEIIKEATDRICSFYYDANDLFFKKASDKIDALFIGNDFGTQNGLIISPNLFRQFFLPWIKRFAEQAHNFGLQFVFHSCGGIADIIDDLINAGVDCLHPMQTTARGMDPETLSSKYSSRITFMGGIDTQDLLLNGTKDDVDREIKRLFNAFGNSFILGPSHEALLPSINVENVIHLAQHNRTADERV
ncbi:MAG: hypothetical protein K9L24_01660 [Spirochaetia bacterium]|nr:hypothetical protein [Spirochaetia bacterium]MCF7945547.1 hypothetical protein [Spirochaetia bacterium]MCF7946875.1 hypothetical protein [Spirochaetia bacterium]